MSDEYGQEASVPVFKVILLGSSGVGKTSLLARFVEGQFVEAVRGNIGVDFKSKIVPTEGRDTKLQVWDFAGSERYVSVAKPRFQEADAVLFVYDTSNEESYNDIKTHWIKQLQENGPLKPNVVMYVVGTKTDLTGKKKVQAETAKQFAHENAWKHFETSAKSGTNVQELFENVALAVLSEYNKNRKKAGDEWVDEDDKKKKCLVM